jgi:hypothetical protein
MPPPFDLRKSGTLALIAMLLGTFCPFRANDNGNRQSTIDDRESLGTLHQENMLPVNHAIRIYYW